MTCSKSSRTFALLAGEACRSFVEVMRFRSAFGGQHRSALFLLAPPRSDVLSVELSPRTPSVVFRFLAVLGRFVWGKAIARVQRLSAIHTQSGTELKTDDAQQAAALKSDRFVSQSIDIEEGVVRYRESVLSRSDSVCLNVRL